MAKTFSAVATLIGTIIGAGILGIPFVVMRSGFLVGVLNMLVVFGIMLFVYLYLGEIGLRTKQKHHLPGYAERYLGEKGKTLMLLALAFGIYASLIAYLIGEGESLSFIFFNTTQYSLQFGIAFWLLLSILSYFGLKALEDSEELGIIIIAILFILITVLFWNKIDVSNLTSNNFSLFYAPFGVILFAFLGFASLPGIERALENHKKETKRVIWISLLTTLFLYILFALIIVGSQGTSTPELVTLALGKPFILLGMFTMFTSYMAITFALMETFKYDYKQTHTKSWLYTISLPLIIFVILHFLNASSFIKVLGIGGVISGGLTGILILLMVKKAKQKGNRKPEYTIPYSKILTWMIIIILAVGTILEVFNTIYN